MRLDNCPTLQIQPCDYSCVPTCLAMAFGIPVDTVLSELATLGVSIKKGMTDRMTSYYLMTKGVNSAPVFCGNSLGIIPGHYLASVPSLNFAGVCHSVFVHYNSEGEIRIYDPNNGRVNRKYWDIGDWGDMSISSFLHLEDYSDLKTNLTLVSKM